VAGAAVAGGCVGAAVVAAGPQAARRSIAMIDRLKTDLLNIFFLLEIEYRYESIGGGCMINSLVG